jgi:hypothetical protein
VSEATSMTMQRSLYLIDYFMNGRHNVSRISCVACERQTERSDGRREHPRQLHPMLDVLAMRATLVTSAELV